jgi:phage shock protein A
MPNAEELEQIVEDMKRELRDARQDVAKWSDSKRADAEATMYAPSLSTMYEVV